MGGDVLAQWTKSSRSTAVALVGGGEIRDANPRFHQLDGGGEAWRWLNGPHAKVRYGTLSELVRAEAATLAPVPYLSRFERARQVIEVRRDRDGALGGRHGRRAHRGQRAAAPARARLGRGAGPRLRQPAPPRARADAGRRHRPGQGPRGARQSVRHHYRFGTRHARAGAV